MNQFTPFVFSTGRARNVAKVNAHAGAEAANLRWLVGFGEKTEYTRAGAAQVQEVGNLCCVMAFGIEHANKTKKPVVLLSDDVRGFFALVGPPSRWTCQNGRRLALSDFTARILASMRQVAAPLGGVTCTADPRVQLAAPWVSYSHFFTMDFMVMDPPINFPVETHTDVQHKLDYGIIAAALAAVGAVCRLNRFSVDAPHFTTGGAGKLATRRESDKRTCSWLIRRWGPKAFRLNPFARRGRHTGHLLGQGNLGEGRQAIARIARGALHGNGADEAAAQGSSRGHGRPDGEGGPWRQGHCRAESAGKE